MLRRWVAPSKRSKANDLHLSRKAERHSLPFVNASKTESTGLRRLEEPYNIAPSGAWRSQSFCRPPCVTLPFAPLGSRTNHAHCVLSHTLQRTWPIKNLLTHKYFHGTRYLYQQQPSSLLNLNVDHRDLDSEDAGATSERLVREENDLQSSFAGESTNLVTEVENLFESESTYPRAPEREVKSARGRVKERKRSKEFWRHNGHDALISRARNQIGDRKYDDALRTIVQAVKTGANVESRKFLKVCALLLRDAPPRGGRYQYSADIMAKLLELGVNPTIVLYNILIRRSAEANDPATAWEIYNLIRANGISPDEVTYIILMKLCRQMGDKLAYGQLHGHLQPEYLNYMGPNLITEVLCCRHYFENQYSFDHMLLSYERYCDLQPLKDLGMIKADHTSRFLASHPLPRPQASAETLNVMLMAFLKSHPSLASTAKIYGNFQERLRLRDRSIIPLVGNESTYNIFLMAASRHRVSFGVRPGIQDHGNPQLLWYNMLKAMSTPPPRRLRNPQTRKPLEQLQPTEKTWSIIANAYAREGCVAETEGIIELMKNQGLEVGTVTFNSLIGGFSRKQEVDYVAKLFHRMKSESIAINSETARSLSYIEDRKRLLEKLRELQSTDKREL